VHHSKMGCLTSEMGVKLRLGGSSAASPIIPRFRTSRCVREGLTFVRAGGLSAGSHGLYTASCEGRGGGALGQLRADRGPAPRLTQQLVQSAQGSTVHRFPAW
jgi:hypothetical protein